MLMLRITTCNSGDSNLILKVAGRLTADDCGEFDQFLKDALQHYQHVEIDMEEVISVDRPSVEFLARIRRAGISLVHSRPYVKRWVEQTSLEPGSTTIKRRLK